LAIGASATNVGATAVGVRANAQGLGGTAVGERAFATGDFSLGRR
jgi:hypothetical protein